MLVSIFVYGQDVFRYSAPIPDPVPGTVYPLDKRLFYPPEGYNFRGNKGLRSGAGVVTFGDQLIVADAGRVVFWNGLDTLTNGKPFDGYVGSTVFNFQFSCCGYIKKDSNNRLWVQGYTEGIHVYQLPLTHQAGGDRDDPAARLLGSGAGGRIADAEPFLHRRPRAVPRRRIPLGLRYLQPSSAADPQPAHLASRRRGARPDRRLRESCAIAASFRRRTRERPWSRTRPCSATPGALSFDRQGNLFVSDHAPEVEGNWRLLRFAGTLFPANNTAPLFDVPATKIFPYRGGQPAITFEPAFDSANRMVVGYNSYLGGNFVGVYNDPAGPSTDPDIYLNDFGSWPSGITFDANDNLYVGDANRARLLVYRKPLAQVFCVPPAAPVASNNGPICAGETLQLTASAVPGATYAWTGPSGFMSSEQNPQIVSAPLSAAGMYRVAATVNACASPQATTSVVIRAVPSTAISAPALACANSSGNPASVPSAGASATYDWSIANGTITSGAGTGAITFTAGGSGLVQLDVTVTDANGCTAEGAKSVTIGFGGSLRWKSDSGRARGQGHTRCGREPVSRPGCGRPFLLSRGRSALRWRGDSGKRRTVAGAGGGSLGRGNGDRRFRDREL